MNKLDRMALDIWADDIQEVQDQVPFVNSKQAEAVMIEVCELLRVAAEAARHE